MLTDDMREQYRTNRAKYPGITARTALDWARAGDPRTGRFGLTWTDHPGTYSQPLTGSGRVGEFDVRVTILLDDDPIIDGTFTDRPGPDTIQNPAWRPNTHNTLRFYDPLTPVGEHRRGLSANGVDRHRAYTQAVSYVRAAAKSDAEPERYIIRARVISNGVSLGESTIRGFDVAEVWADARERLITAANDVIEDAIGEGRARLAKLVATLPARPGMRISINDSYPNTDEMACALRAIADMLAEGFTSGIWPHNFDLTGQPTTADDDEERA